MKFLKEKLLKKKKATVIEYNTFSYLFFSHFSSFKHYKKYT